MMLGCKGLTDCLSKWLIDWLNSTGNLQADQQMEKFTYLLAEWPIL